MKKITRQFLISLCMALVLVPVLAVAATSKDALIGLGLPPELAARIYTTLIGVDSNGNIVLPVAASKKLSVTVGGTELFSSSSAGLVTAAAGVTATAGDITATNGEFIASTSGKTLAIQEATAGAKCMGTATANGTTAVTVSTTCVTTASRIFISATSDGTGAAGNDQGACWATNIVNAVSFDLDCPDANNNAAYNWIIFHEAA